MSQNPYIAPNSALHSTEFAPLSLNLNVTMKLLALAPQFYLYDLSGKQVGFIKQKLFKFKEAIEVYSDASKTHLRYKISADRVIDFSANYHFTSVRDGVIGRTTQNGMRSLWRTEFEVLDSTGTRFFIRLKNPMAQFLEGLLSIIPVVGDILNVVSGYFLNPTYVVTKISGDEVATMKKLPALWEGKYEIRSTQNLTERDGELIALSLLTLILMQRASDG